jgi:hypothetical protein
MAKPQEPSFPLVPLICAILAFGTAAFSQDKSPAGDIPKSFTPPTADLDFIKRDVMIPMRDGVKLHTVIVIPKGARNAPILLTRTPYNASARTARNNSQHIRHGIGRISTALPRFHLPEAAPLPSPEATLTAQIAHKFP